VITVIDSGGNETDIDPETADENEDGDIVIEDDEGNVWIVDDEGVVSGPHSPDAGGGSTDGTDTNQTDQREELTDEILGYLEETIIAWQDDNSSNLPECIPANNDMLNPLMEQITTYQRDLNGLLAKYSNDDQTTLSDYVNTYNEAEDPTSYQNVLNEEEWQAITCRTYNYLNDLAQGMGEVAEDPAGRTKLENFMSDYRTAYQQGSNNFTFSSANFGEVYPTDYNIQGVASIKMGLVDKRESDDYEPSLSSSYVLEDVSGQKEIAGTDFEASAVFQFGKANWSFMDKPEFLLYGYHSEAASGLDSKTLLQDYLPGKYDYEAIESFVNKIIDSHDKGEETLDMISELSGKQVYARNVDFGDKGKYDLYISRTGDFSDDSNSFYNYSKTEINEVFGFTGTFTQYRFVNVSGGLTSITIPTSQCEKFEKMVLKLHAKNSGKDHVDLVNAIRAANLNVVAELNITKYGIDGGSSPVFEIDHDGKKLKLMVFYPSGISENIIDPSKRPSQSSVDHQSAMGDAGSYVIFEFQNKTVDDSGHNMYMYVLEDQIELFESYLLIAEEVLLTGINWRNQGDQYFNNDNYPCYNSPNGNVCCMQASLTVLEQFGVTTNVNEHTNIAEFVNPDIDYSSLKSTSNFESQLEYLHSTIKSNKEGGQPVLVGVHYNRGTEPYNESNPATYHFIVLVGKGYDKEIRKYYFRFYDVGEADDEVALSDKNRLYVDENLRMIKGSIDGKNYTITEVRQNIQKQ
jgi:hypothetical protein